MIESYENAIQVTVLLACLGIALIRAVSQRERGWTLLFFFYGSWALGDLYWLLCLIFFDKSPQFSVVSDLSWYASFIFLYLLICQIAPPEKDSKWLLPWLGPLFTTGMALYYMQWGNVISNLICAAMLGLLLYAAIARLLDRKTYGRQRFLCVMIIIFCLLEHGLWISSCIFEWDGLRNPYYWFDFLLTLSFPCFLPATKKAVAS